MTLPALVLIDSSVWVAALRASYDAAAASAVDQIIAEDRAATCEVVIMEVLRGVSARGGFATVASELRATHCLSMDGAGERAALLAQRLRSDGLTIPPTDLLIAATCALHGVALLHRDQHLALAAEALGLVEYPIV